MRHLPVMLAETLEQLAIKKNGIYIDCTFGRGGHSQGILNQLENSGQLLALDRDSEAIESESAKVLLQDSRFKLRHCRFSKLASVIEAEGLTGKIDGVLFDLGVSSPQLDQSERGFSFLRDGPLDMRMDRKAGFSAQQWLAQIEEPELVRILFDYGEERFARRIAHAIIESRSTTPIATTRQLAELVESAMPYRDRHKHSATRTFQAIRIAINSELDELKEALTQSLGILTVGGRLVVISFHSLEDRIVKRFMRDESGFKQEPGRLPLKESQLTRGSLRKVGKAIRAGSQETAINPRARSAIMRVAERV